MARSVRDAGIPVTVLRPFSGYGADQDPRYPFRAFVERAKARQDPFEVWGDGSQVRDWVHISDVVGATLAAVDNDVDGPVNVCTGIGTTFTDLAHQAMRAAGYRAPISYQLDKPAGVPYRVGDPTKMHEFYMPKVPLGRALHDAIQGG
jgi:nucleoside-diphosphate-sugar epimerase